MAERALYITRLSLAGRHIASQGGGSSEAKQELDRCRLEDRSWEWHHLLHQINERKSQLLGRETKPTTVAISHANDALACGGEDGKLRALRLDGREIWTQDTRAIVGRVAYTRGDRAVIAQVGEREIRAFDARDGSPLRTRNFGALVFEVAASGLRDEVYVSARDAIHVLDATSLESLRSWPPVAAEERERRKLSARSAGAHRMTVDDTRAVLVTGHWDRRMRIWSIEDGRLIRTDTLTAPHASGLTTLHDGRIACASFDFLGRTRGAIDVFPPADAPTARVHDALAALKKTLDPEVAKYVPAMTPISIRPRSPYGVCALPGRSQFVTGANILEIQDVDRRERRRSIRGAKHVREVACDRLGTTLYVASASGLESYSLVGTRYQTNLQGFGGVLSRLAFSPSSDRLAMGDTSGRLRICDASSGSRVASRAAARGASTARVQNLTWLDAKTLLCLQKDGLLRTMSGKLELLDELALEHSAVDCVVGSSALHVQLADGTLVSLEGSGALAQRARSEHRFGSSAVTSLAFDPKKRRLAVGAEDGRLYIVDEATRELRSEWSLPGEVRSVAFSPDGEQIIALAAPLRIELRDVATGRVLRHWTLPSRPGSKVLWSPRGDRFFSTDWTGLLRVYDPQLDESILQSGPTNYLLVSLAVDTKHGLVAVGGNGSRAAILRGQPWHVR